MAEQPTQAVEYFRRFGSIGENVDQLSPLVILGGHDASGKKLSYGGKDFNFPEGVTVWTYCRNWWGESILNIPCRGKKPVCLED